MIKSPKNMKKIKKCAYCGHPKSEHTKSGICNHKSHRTKSYQRNFDFKSYCKCPKYIEEKKE